MVKKVNHRFIQIYIATFRCFGTSVPKPETAVLRAGACPERALRGERVEGWNRDEWDVALADGGIYRIYRDRSRDQWFVDGIVD